MDHEELLSHARALASSGKGTEASEVLEHLIQQGNASAMNDLAVSLIKTSSKDSTAVKRATQLLVSAIELGNSSAILNLAQLRRREKKREQAEILFNEALYKGQIRASQFLLEDITKPVDNLRILIGHVSESHNKDNLHRLARAFREKKKFISAKFWFQKTYSAGRIQAVLELADMYRRDMNDQNQFTELVKFLSNDTPFLAHLIKGQAHLDEREITKALHHFKSALQDNNQSTDALKKISQCHKALDQGPTFDRWITDVQNKEYWHLLPLISTELKSRGQTQKAKYWTNLWNITQEKSLKLKNETQEKTKPAIDPSPAKKSLDQMSSPTQEDETLDNEVKINSNYETWVIQAQTHTSASFIARNSHFLKTLFNFNRELCPLIGNWMGYRVTEDWLDEILAKYEDQRSIQRLDPVWPIRFESDDFQIILSIEGSWLRAWVGRSNCGGIIAIRLSDFDIQSALRDEDRIFAVGVAISFFLDRTINLDSNGHPHFLQNNDGSIHPTSKFDLDVDKTRSGQRQAMESHMVSGHARTLPKGQIASLEALARAPIYVRRNLKPNQTFVRGHQRNGPVLTETVIRYLKTNSNLADAIGTFR
jgi:tetratricopeptide (TPR) repeat protein